MSASPNEQNVGKLLSDSTAKLGNDVRARACAFSAEL